VPYSLASLAADVQEVVASTSDQRELTAAIVPCLRRWLEAPDLTEEQQSPCEGAPCGHLLHEAPDGSFFIISVVFPAGTSSGVHYHGDWGVVGVLSGTDEETKYESTGGQTHAAIGAGCSLRQMKKDLYPAGSITLLLPPDKGVHRVRAVGEETGVSLHILGGTPTTHAHLLCHPERRRWIDFPMAALLDQVPPKV
jgi:predicted metal-dependent enzyme (double-stranded beta helix superfamily)